jgi:hypothetical protein
MAGTGQKMAGQVGSEPPETGGEGGEFGTLNPLFS